MRPSLPPGDRDPLLNAIFACSIARGAVMCANWDGEDRRFHEALDSLRFLQDFLSASKKLGEFVSSMESDDVTT